MIGWAKRGQKGQKRLQQALAKDCDPKAHCADIVQILVDRAVRIDAKKNEKGKGNEDDDDDDDNSKQEKKDELAFLFGSQSDPKGMLSMVTETLNQHFPGKIQLKAMGFDHFSDTSIYSPEGAASEASDSSSQLLQLPYDPGSQPPPALNFGDAPLHGVFGEQIDGNSDDGNAEGDVPSEKYVPVLKTIVSEEDPSRAAVVSNETHV
jgi:hypothetical protein